MTQIQQKRLPEAEARLDAIENELSNIYFFYFSKTFS